MDIDDIEVIEKERVLDYFIREDGNTRFQRILLNEQSLISKTVESAHVSMLRSSDDSEIVRTVNHSFARSGVHDSSVASTKELN